MARREPSVSDEHVVVAEGRRKGKPPGREQGSTLLGVEIHLPHGEREVPAEVGQYLASPFAEVTGFRRDEDQLGEGRRTLPAGVGIGSLDRGHVWAGCRIGDTDAQGRRSRPTVRPIPSGRYDLGERRSTVRALGELEMEVMGVLWSEAGWTTPGEMQAKLTRPLAYTTVMTVMSRLHRKGLLQRQRDGRAYAYAPVMTREEWLAAQMRSTLTRSPDRSSVLARFVERLDPDQVTQLRRMIRSREVGDAT